MVLLRWRSIGLSLFSPLLLPGIFSYTPRWVGPHARVLMRSTAAVGVVCGDASTVHAVFKDYALAQLANVVATQAVRL